MSRKIIDKARELLDEEVEEIDKSAGVDEVEDASDATNKASDRKPNPSDSSSKVVDDPDDLDIEEEEEFDDDDLVLGEEDEDEYEYEDEDDYEDEEEDDDDDVLDEEIDITEHVSALFEDAKTLDEGFKSKAATIFEAAVSDAAARTRNTLREQYERKLAKTRAKLTEEFERKQEELVEQLDSYLSYVAEEWMTENQIAIETGIRVQMAENIIKGLHSVLSENYVSVPEEKIDLLDEANKRVAELESQLNESIEKNVSLAKEHKNLLRKQVFAESVAGLPDTQIEKLRTLSESVEFKNADDYRTKLSTLRESYFGKGKKEVQVLTEEEQNDGTGVLTEENLTGEMSRINDFLRKMNNKS